MIRLFNNSAPILLTTFTLTVMTFFTPTAISQSEKGEDSFSISKEDHTVEICREDRVVDEELNYRGYKIKLSCE